MSIQFNPRIPRLPDILAQAGFDYCGAVAFPDGCACVCCFSLADIVRCGQDNCLKPLDGLKCRKGVYIVIEDDTALYVGSSIKVTNSWSLPDRIAQHFRGKDSGATLRENWQRMHSGCDYRQFVRRMRGCRLQVVSFQKEADNQQVLRLEHLLIGLLGPRYCDVQDPARSSQAS